MRGEFQGKTWGRFVRLGALAAAVMAMAGCATGYSFVQPNVTGGGGYYTSEGPYAGAGYYGGGLYASPFGWYGGYGPYGYGSSFSLSLGFGNASGWPFYGGLFGGLPGYYPGFGYYPFYGFGGYRVRRYHRGYYHGGQHRRGGHYYHGRHDRTGMAGRHEWMNTQSWRGRRFADDSGAPRHAVSALGRASFAPQDFVHAPARVSRVRGVMAMAPERLMDPPRANGNAVAARHMMRMPSAVAMPREFRAVSAPAFRSAMSDMSMPRAMPQSFRAMPQPAFRAAPVHFAAPRAGGRQGIKRQ